MAGSYSAVFDGFYRVVAVLLVIFVPLGLWKLADIILWLVRNISISFGG